MNRIFKNEVQSHFMRIVRRDGVAHDAPHEAGAVPASRPTHAGHSAPPLAYHASSREHTDREAHSGHDQHASHSAEMFLSPIRSGLPRYKIRPIARPLSFRSVANRLCAGMMMPVRMMLYVSYAS